MIAAFDTNLHSQVRTRSENTPKVCKSFSQPCSGSFSKGLAYLQPAGIWAGAEVEADTEDKFATLPLLLRYVDWVGEKGRGSA